jgi:predicted nucleic acid-binding protein
VKKLKIYLDTSVVSYLQQDDAPDAMRDTLKLWQSIKQGEYETFLSEVTSDEIGKCYEPKKAILTKYLFEIIYTEIKLTDEIDALAQKFVENNILRQKSIDDCRHIACSIISGCDIIVSWNFKHIVNYKTIKGIKLISLITGYKDIAIYTSTMLIEGGE